MTRNRARMALDSQVKLPEPSGLERREQADAKSLGFTWEAGGWWSRGEDRFPLHSFSWINNLGACG
jgi:hypothetical protein